MPILADFDYKLPENRIAQSPVIPRDQSKLLVLNKTSGRISDKHFYDLAELLTQDDVLVLNNTKVFPARLLAKRGNKFVELLLEREAGLTDAGNIIFSALTKPGLKSGDQLEIPNTKVRAVCSSVTGYRRHLQFNLGREQFFAILDDLARTPVPPYIKWNQDDEKVLRQKYQTVFAKRQGAVAAPTAGLHFTAELLEKLRMKGVQIKYVTLHVGLGTFLPVKTDDITKHQMHEEWFELDEPTANHLNVAKAGGKRIIAVGTTTVRVLESCAKHNALTAQSGYTRIYIYPPYKFKFVDAVITNFHTPKSTLLMLTAALTSLPNTGHSFTTFANSLMGRAYRHALENNYRFYSFGDAMLIM